jgi:hypothetical protein
MSGYSGVLASGFQILGNVHNNETEDVTVRIVAEIYNSSDKLLAVESGEPEFSDISPNNYSPFRISSNTKTNLTSIDRVVFSCSYEIPFAERYKH